MSRFSGHGAAVLTVALMCLGALTATPATAAGKLPKEPGGLTIAAPAGGEVLPVLIFSTDSGCQQEADYYYGKVYGPSLPDEGQLVVNGNIGLSKSAPWSVPALYTFIDVVRNANGQAATVVPGRYVVEIVCADELMESLKTWTGSLTFTSPTTYEVDAGSLATAQPSATPSASPSAAGTGAPASPRATGPAEAAPAPSAPAQAPSVAGSATAEPSGPGPDSSPAPARVQGGRGGASDTASGSDSALARTGGTAGTVALLAGVLLAAGVVLLRLSRRRERA